jgi:hypothetical protein
MISGNALEFDLQADGHIPGRIRTAFFPLIDGLTKFGAPVNRALGR